MGIQRRAYPFSFIAAVAVTADSGIMTTLKLVDADCVSRLLCGLQSIFLKHTYRILRLYVISSTEHAFLTECFTADIIAGIIWAIASRFYVDAHKHRSADTRTGSYSVYACVDR
eukprot:COSAG05_NODE_1316_length_5210_cov_51.150851_4_plen_114_part_00